MGVDCRIWLPGNCQVRNVASVAALALGCKVKKVELDDKTWYVQVEGLHVESCPNIPMCALINIECERADGARKTSLLYHFEPCGQNSTRRLIMARSNAIYLALGHRLVDFFGGAIEHSDHEDRVNYSVMDKGWMNNSPEDGYEWQFLQERLMDVKPISHQEWLSFDKYATYKVD